MKLRGTARYCVQLQQKCRNTTHKSSSEGTCVHVRGRSQCECSHRNERVRLQRARACTRVHVRYVRSVNGALVIFHGVIFSLHFHSLEGAYSLVRSLGGFWLFWALFARGRHFARGLLQFASFTRGRHMYFWLHSLGGATSFSLF